MQNTKIISLIGGGPAALFMFKRLADSSLQAVHVHIFERKNELGSGMPYSWDGALEEHVTNISANETPGLKDGVMDWLQKAEEGTLGRFQTSADDFHEYKVLPRLLFGVYLKNQFQKYIRTAKENGMTVTIHYNTVVEDIVPLKEKNAFIIITNDGQEMETDIAIVCTGHFWPAKCEGTVKGYYDSPYPPSKLQVKANYPVAIRGASLTAIDAIKTLALANGQFTTLPNGMLQYVKDEGSENFKMNLHSINGLLPSVRFHYEDAMVDKSTVLNEEEISLLKDKHDGFIPLDIIFEKSFKLPLKEKQPEFYEKIKDMDVESFNDFIMTYRKSKDAFQLLAEEYRESAASIQNQESIYWKEMISVLNFAVNHPAKHMSAEDNFRLKRYIMPIVSLIIAYIPQSSVKTLLALHEAGALDIIAVDRESKIVIDDDGGIAYHFKNKNNENTVQPYAMYVDCIGQQPYAYDNIPFSAIKNAGLYSPALIRFKDADEAEKEKAGGQPVGKDEAGHYYLKMPGVYINDHFQILDGYGAATSNFYVMAVPMIAGMNPDYSGLDFCERASQKIMEAIGRE